MKTFQQGNTTANMSSPQGNESMEYEIDLRDLFQMVKKRIKMIIAIVILAMMVSGLVSFFVLTPIYQTATTLMVGKTTSQELAIQYSDILLSQKITKTYAEIAKSKTVLKKTIDVMGSDMTAGQLGGYISVNPLSDTEIIKITVTHPDPVIAATIANSLAGVFKEDVTRIMKIDNVQVIDPAEVPHSPIKPNPIMNIAIAAILGLMLSLGLIFLMEYLDNTIKTPEDIEKILGVHVIGVIPIFEENKMTKSRKNMED